ncbi:uncharacterized protein LOC144152645 isoform X10 [Haemaphysalis longicornis]
MTTPDQPSFFFRKCCSSCPPYATSLVGRCGDRPSAVTDGHSHQNSNHITKKSACNTPMAQKSPKQADMYWFAYAADPPAERQRRGLWAQQVDELASPEQELDGAAGAQKESPCSPLDTYWFAHAGGDTPNEDGGDRRLSPDRSQQVEGEGDSPQQQQASPLSREERLRLVKERQEEQRARRLQELEQQAQAAQHYQKQVEEERRRRIEEARHRDHERRQQVEERKRLIWEADHERKEAMLRRNMERETKLDARRNTNRMSMSFAFGSSTPRTFDLDLATMSSAGAPVLMSAAPLRKSEERDFESSRKRAASAYNLCQAADAAQTDPTPGQGTVPDVAFVSPTVGGWLVGSGVTVDPRRRQPLGCLVSGPVPGEDPMTRSMTALPSQHSRGRRKTDLMPVIPWNRSSGASPSPRPSAAASSGTAAGKEQPSPSRPRSSLSVASEQSAASSQMSSSVVMRPRPPPRKPRPLSIAGTIPDKALQGPAPAAEKKKAAPRAEGAPEVPPKPAHLRKPQKPQPPAAAAFRREQRPPAPPARAAAKEAQPKERAASREKSAPPPSKEASPAPSGVPASLPTAAVAPIVAMTAVRPPSAAPSAPPDVVASNVVADGAQQPLSPEDSEGKPESSVPQVPKPPEAPVAARQVEGKANSPAAADAPAPAPAVPSAEPSAEEGSTPSKPAPRVISEEEARALLAEKRRLAREQAEREAELERQRQEELRRQEEERQRQEEEEQRRAEEEQLRLAEEFRRQEEEKLQRAIEEQQKREAEERERRELEAQQKAEREEQERKAREEAERQRKELEERLKREEAERAERKKRVEEIMSRTRRRGGKDSAGKTGDAQASPERESSPSVSGRSSPQVVGKAFSDEDKAAAPGTGAGEQQQQQQQELRSEQPPAAEEQGAGEASLGLGVGGTLAAGSPAGETCVNGREPIVVERVVDSGSVGGGGPLPPSEEEGGSATVEPMDQSPPQGKCFSPPSVTSEGNLAADSPCTNGYSSHHTNGGGHNILNGSEKVADLLGLDSLDSLGPLKPEALHSSTGSPAVENMRNAGGDINSNRIVPPGNPLIGFEADNRNNSAKTQEMQFTDLLS